MKQANKILRLVDIKQLAVEHAEAAHAAAQAKTAAANEAYVRAEAAWLEAASAKEGELETVSELQDRDLRIRKLWRVLQDAQRAFSLARSAAAMLQDKLIDARIDLRRFEMWLERKREEQANEARRLERIAEDERAGRRQVA
jgi:hypothetical protein